MPATSSIETGKKPEARSAVSNGSRLLSYSDGRSVWARRCRDLIQLHVEDLGGPDAVSEAERSICRRVAVLTTELERLEAQFSQAAPSDKALDLYQRTAGNLRRLLESVGIERRQRRVNGETLPPILGKP